MRLFSLLLFVFLSGSAFADNSNFFEANEDLFMGEVITKDQKVALLTDYYGCWEIEDNNEIFFAYIELVKERAAYFCTDYEAGAYADIDGTTVQDVENYGSTPPGVGFTVFAEYREYVDTEAVAYTLISSGGCLVLDQYDYYYSSVVAIASAKIVMTSTWGVTSTNCTKAAAYCHFCSYC